MEFGESEEYKAWGKFRKKSKIEGEFRVNLFDEVPKNHLYEQSMGVEKFIHHLNWSISNKHPIKFSNTGSNLNLKYDHIVTTKLALDINKIIYEPVLDFRESATCQWHHFR